MLSANSLTLIRFIAFGIAGPIWPPKQVFPARQSANREQRFIPSIIFPLAHTRVLNVSAHDLFELRQTETDKTWTRRSFWPPQELPR